MVPYLNFFQVSYMYMVLFRCRFYLYLNPIYTCIYIKKIYCRIQIITTVPLYEKDMWSFCVLPHSACKENIHVHIPGIPWLHLDSTKWCICKYWEYSSAIPGTSLIKDQNFENQSFETAQRSGFNQISESSSFNVGAHSFLNISVHCR